MATSFDVNLNIGSQIGYTLPGNPKLLGYAPDIQTTATLNGELIPYSGVNSLQKSPLLVISASPTADNIPLDDFIMSTYQTSTYQTLYLKNKGNAVLTITDVIMTYSDGIEAVFRAGATTLPITIQPGSQTNVSGAYYAFDSGIYDNFFVFQSNSISGYEKVRTHQIVLDTQNFRTIPLNFSTSTNKIGQVVTQTYKLIPIFNNIEYPDSVITVDGSISGNGAWYIVTTGTNSITIAFDSNQVNNINGVYSADLTILANGATHKAINTATVVIDHDKNKNLSNWMSPASHYNSIIGVSYDLEDDVRILTVGVGMGGDGVPIYGDGGSLYANVNNLGLGSGDARQPYTFWSKVYRIPFTGAAQIYNSSDYVIKTTTASDYSSYFGENHAPGSMFIVEDDGYGSLKIELNHLKEFYDEYIDDTVKTTLINLTRAFYYYSNVDRLGRYEPLPVEYSAPIVTNTATTNLFIGFNYNTRDKLAYVNSSIVELPI